MRITHWWAPDARARLTGRWVDYRVLQSGLVCIQLLRVLLSRDKHSDDEQSWTSAWMTDWVSSVYHLLSALVLMGHLQLSICLLTLPAVVCPILASVKLYFYTPAPVCRVDVVKFGADACRCDAVISHTVAVLVDFSIVCHRAINASWAMSASVCLQWSYRSWVISCDSFPDLSSVWHL